MLDASPATRIRVVELGRPAIEVDGARGPPADREERRPARVPRRGAGRRRPSVPSCSTRSSAGAPTTQPAPTCARPSTGSARCSPRAWVLRSTAARCASAAPCRCRATPPGPSRCSPRRRACRARVAWRCCSTRWPCSTGASTSRASTPPWVAERREHLGGLRADARLDAARLAYEAGRYTEAGELGGGRARRGPLPRERVAAADAGRGHRRRRGRRHRGVPGVRRRPGHAGRPAVGRDPAACSRASVADRGFGAVNAARRTLSASTGGERRHEDRPGVPGVAARRAPGLRRRRADRGRHDAPEDPAATPSDRATTTTCTSSPSNQDVLTFVDDDGNRQSMHWFLPAIQGGRAAPPRSTTSSGSATSRAASSPARRRA